MSGKNKKTKKTMPHSKSRILLLKKKKKKKKNNNTDDPPYGMTEGRMRTDNSSHPRLITIISMKKKKKKTQVLACWKK